MENEFLWEQISACALPWFRYHTPECVMPVTGVTVPFIELYHQLEASRSWHLLLVIRYQLREMSSLSGFKSVNYVQMIIRECPSMSTSEETLTQLKKLANEDQNPDSLTKSLQKNMTSPRNLLAWFLISWQEKRRRFLKQFNRNSVDFKKIKESYTSHYMLGQKLRDKRAEVQEILNMLWWGRD